MNVHVGEISAPREVDDLHLVKGDAFLLMGKQWVVESRCSNPVGYIVVDASAPHVDHPMASSDIKLWHREGQLEFVMKSEFGLPVGVRESLRRTLRAFHKTERREIFRRLRYCQRIDKIGRDFPRSGRLQPYIDEVAKDCNDNPCPSWRSVYRWWLVWVRAGRDPRALCPSYRKSGNRERRFEQHHIDAMNKAIDLHYLRRRRSAFSTAYKACNAYITEHLGGADKVMLLIQEQAQLPAEERKVIFPSENAFREECRRRSRAERMLARHGAQAARNALFPVGEGPDVRMPMERVEADFKFLRLFVVDEKTGLPLGAPYLMAGIDCYSTCIVGFDLSFDPPSYVVAGRCLRNIVSYKDMDAVIDPVSKAPVCRNSYPMNGVPYQLVLDNDVVFHSRGLRESARQIGTNLHFVPKAQPWQKGHIERFWLTVDQCFLDMFPGKILRPAQKPGHDYDPAEDAVVTLAMLKAVLTKAIVDTYHQADHPTIPGKTRAQVWDDAVKIRPPRPVRRHEDLIELVGLYDTRKAERRGIRFKGLRYNSYELALYRSGFEEDPWVEIRIDPDDIGSIWIVDQTQGKSFRVPCTRPDYADRLTLHQHSVIQRRAKANTMERFIRMKQLLLAKAELFKMGEQMLGQKSLRGTRKRVAQFLGAGKELIDILSTRRDDPTESAKFLDLGADRDDDTWVVDPEDDARAEQDVKQFKGLAKKSVAKGEVAGSTRGVTVETKPDQITSVEPGLGISAKSPDSLEPAPRPTSETGLASKAGPVLEAKDPEHRSQVSEDRGKQPGLVSNPTQDTRQTPNRPRRDFGKLGITFDV